MQINEKQKKIIVIGVVVIILMAIFPPWTHTYRYKTAYSNEPAGYRFIFYPPDKKSKVNSMAHGIELDITRLCVQWIIFSMVTGLGVFLSSKPKDNKLN